MLFSSIIFIFYFLPIILILYYAFGFSRKIQNFILLISSLFFYAWGEPKFIIIMVISIIMNYIFGLFVDRYREEKSKARICLILMCICNIGILFVFKYLTFTLRNLNSFLSKPISIPNIVLPIGISFFTFQAMSYVIDVYRKDGEVQKNPFYVGLYIVFFPQLIAGPIVKYETVADQMLNRKETWRKFSVGTCRFIIGLGKKVMISNNMAIVADYIYTMSGQGSIAASLAWLGSIAYTFQIFFDFSAYSDMAIGLGLMFGFKFEENFNYPYISKSISEFWRRWHISLGNWFKTYVYFPLGGSRVSNKDIMIRNMLIVWVLTGVWHGAEWTFILWGLLNFVFLTIERFVMFEKIKNHNILKHIYTLLVVNFGWVIFRSPNLQEASSYFKAMFGGSGVFWSDYTGMFLKEYFIFFLCAIVFSMPIAKKINKYVVEKAKFHLIFHMLYPISLIMLFIVSVTYLVTGSYNPFIYFNF
ncbi:MBOAT family protein [Clostridium sp. MSJ-4]|uniref:MBOAT family protein n=1 Tax=Clostridium simiarum TaxID=2841506 RepID=A0ABS6F194_9CLOT|nr:MBOAT family protein [Clostridium simiarum]MBU5591654.1 MBOAT family protein [Clostridium simiarum]